MMTGLTRLPVKALTEQGLIRFTFWQSMTLIGQVLWALFCLPGGFSFLALRLSVLTAGLAGVLGLYGLCRHLVPGTACATLAALTLAFNPIYFGLSCTFMTDVPFTVLLILSILGLLRGARYGERPVSSDRFGSCLCGPVRSPTCPGGIPGLPCRFSAQARLRSPLAPLRDVPHAALRASAWRPIRVLSPLRPASGDVLPEGQFPQ